MITTCLIITAWTAGMPLWASITVTVLAGVRFFCKCLVPFLKIGQYKVRAESLYTFLEQYEGKDLTDPFNVKELDYNV